MFDACNDDMYCFVLRIDNDSFGFWTSLLDRVISEPIICLAAEVLHTFDYVDSFCVSNVTSTGQSLHVLVTKKQAIESPTWDVHLT